MAKSILLVPTSVGLAAEPARASCFNLARMRLARSQSKCVVRMNSVCAASARSSDIMAPAALSAAPASGKTTVRHRRRRAMATPLRPAAPAADHDGVLRIDTLLDGDL